MTVRRRRELSVRASVLVLAVVSFVVLVWALTRNCVGLLLLCRVDRAYRAACLLRCFCLSNLRRVIPLPRNDLGGRSVLVRRVVRLALLGSFALRPQQLALRDAGESFLRV